MKICKDFNLENEKKTLNLILNYLFRIEPKLLHLCSHISKIVSVIAGAGFCMVSFFSLFSMEKKYQKSL